MAADRGVSRERYAQLLMEILPAAGGYSRSIVRIKEDAEDAVQQAAMRGLQNIAAYNPQRSFKAWWFTILRNCCLDVLRANRSRGKLLESASAATATSSQASLDKWEELAVAIERLSHDHAEILRLRYFSSMSYQELSEATDIPLGTVMSRLHVARLRLAEEMERIRS
jgi:RNA polymerase sigma-70 factor (ECF subfamily)